MATFSPYDAGAYERRKRDIEYDYGQQQTQNAYGRFLSQQRGERNLGDMRMNFGRSYAPFKAQYGQRGLGGAGISSGVQRQGMANFTGDYLRDYGRATQDL